MILASSPLSLGCVIWSMAASTVGATLWHDRVLGDIATSTNETLVNCSVVIDEGEPDRCSLGFSCECTCECIDNPCCTGGLFLSGLFEAMRETSANTRAVVYLFLLLWMFMGVGMIADVFMMAIEVITSKEKTITTKTGKVITVLIWNETVANLSLMALGSSAPEILLNVFEIIGEKNFSGALGPSTIVGSAAFNLFVISAVCVIAIPDGEVRNIEMMAVFKCTAFFSVFAYVWLLVILVLSSPDVIEPWEAVVTFGMFFFLLWLAFMADKGKFSKKSNSSDVTPAAEGHIVGITTKDHAFHAIRAYDDPAETAKLVKELKATLGSNLSDDDIEQHIMLQAAQNTRRSRAAYRINATRMMTGGKPVIPKIPEGKLIKRQSVDMTKMVEKSSAFDDAVFFATPAIAVMENIGTFNVHVNCTAKLEGDEKVTVNYTTIAGTATKNDDYEHAEGTIEFNASCSTVAIPITIIDDVEFEPDEHFFIELSGQTGKAKLGKWSKATITIKNDDFPGKVSFTDSTTTILESAGELVIQVIRTDGCSGDITVDYSTEEMGSAVAGTDFEKISGTLMFKHTEEIQAIIVPIIDDETYEKDEKFKIVLSNPSGGAEVGDTASVVVTIRSDDKVAGMADKLTQALNLNRDMYKIGSSSWGQQFQDAITLEVEEGEKPSIGTYIGFAFALPFKVVFATVPPTAFCGGQLCFVVALMYIGCVTILIGDLASQLGCVLGLEDEITAITLVALGTSLPDTFASMAAARGDPAADAAIGNITGSNAVNVFLGLGLPWLIGAIYWAGQDPVQFGPDATITDNDGQTWFEKYKALPFGCFEDKEPFCIPFRKESWAQNFVVVAGNLSYSVGIFSTFATICLLTLVFRQAKFNAMLGGPDAIAKGTACFFGSLWCIYILMNIIKIKESASSCP